MNYLWSAAAKLTNAGSVPGLPGYTLGERDVSFDGRTIWTLSTGVKRDDQTPVSVFSFDAANARSALPLARNALRKLRTLRHPDVLKFLDGIESDAGVHIVTEPVVPLTRKLDGTPPLSDEAKVWGLSRLATALKFINGAGASTHGNLRPTSIFLSPSGEWRLGGFDLLSSPKDSDPVLYSLGSMVRESGTYASPEVRRSGFGALRDLDPHVLDSYQLHLLLHVIFNGPLPAAFTTELAPTLPATRGNIPAAIFPCQRKLGAPDPRARLKTETFCDLGFGLVGSAAQQGAGFFRSNRLVKLSEGLEGFALASEGDRALLVKTVRESVDVLPPEFLSYKVLPALVHAFEFGPGGPQLLPLVLSLGTSLSATEYTQHLVQPVVRAFASPDRLMRMALLESLPTYVERLDQKTVVDKIWPNLLTGFSDVVPVIREATVKSILLIAPKLSERVLNNDLLRYLAKAQVDPEAGIRTNTCILLGRLSKHLATTTCRKVLVPAFARSLRDPFVHARIAGLMALMATVECYEREDIAGKVIPAMSICLVDKEKSVRDQAFKAIDMFVKRVEQLVVGMPDTVLPPAASPSSQSVALPDAAAASAPGLATTAGGAAGALAGWAFSSLGKKLMPGDLQTQIERVASPPVNGGAVNGSAPIVLRPALAAAGSTGMDSASTSDAGDWGGDLMDANADEDDWNAFEEAPVPLENPKPIAASRLSSKPRIGARAPAAGGSLRLGATNGAMSRSQLALELGASHGSLTALILAEAEAEDAGLERAEPTNAFKEAMAASEARRAASAAAVKPRPVVARPSPVSPPRAPRPAAAPAPPVEPSWGDFDDAPAPAAANPTGEDKAATMARMKAERQARMAAARAARKA